MRRSRSHPSAPNPSPRHRRGFRLALSAAALLPAACQPLPHPFADDKPPASLMTVRDSVGVSIGPIEGEPRATANKLGAAVAKALLGRDIPASNRTTSLGSYILYGRIETVPLTRDKANLVASWRLRDAAGRIVGEPREVVEAPARDWESGNDEAVVRLAAASAEKLVTLLEDEAPVEAAAGGRTRTRVAIGRITGAPGDGATALATAVAAVLKRQDVDIVGDPNLKADLAVEAEVSVSAAGSNKQHVKIVWHVRRPAGPEIGTVGQENDVPRGFDGAWGDIAYSIAIAAGSGLAELVARGTPPPGAQSPTIAGAN